MNLHLTHEQLCDLLLADSSSPEAAGSTIVQEHLHACHTCAAEFENLRESLAIFREATSSYASQIAVPVVVRPASIAPPHRYLMQPLYWAVAAALLVVTSLPFTLHRQPAPEPTMATTTTLHFSAPHAAESDEALLEDIDQQVFADVPAPMQPLADPTAQVASTESSPLQRNN